MQQIQEAIHTLSIGSREGNNPPSPEKVGHTTEVYVQYSFQCSGVGSFRSHKYQISPGGPTVFIPYPRRLQSLTVFRCRYEGSTFLILSYLKNLSVGPAWV